MSDVRTSPLIFGIYPGGHTGFGSGQAITADDPARVREALDHLQAGNSPFLVRGYLPYTGSFSAAQALAIKTPVAVEQYIQDGRKLDLVLQFRQPDLDGWLTFIRQAIHRYNSMLATLQITEEANVTMTPEVDGCIPQVREALVRGVIAAKEEIQRSRLDIQVGFNAAPSLDPTDDFWPNISALGGQSFLNALDYVGLDFFPDVFRPLSDAREATLRAAVVGVLSHFRNVSLAASKIPPTCPIHITENGCPTAPARSPERQAEVVEQVIRTIHEHREQFNITHYEHFALRDANSSNPNLLSQFGLLRDDYHPKPAFERYRYLIAEFGRTIPTR
jgi:hypothetical protein